MNFDRLLTTEVLSLTIAGIAVIFGPIISYLIAKKQLRAEIIYASHLDDLKTLRNTLLDLLKTYSEIAFLVNQKTINAVSQEEFSRKLQPIFTELLLHRDKISLLIDIKNLKHLVLLDEVHKIAEVILNESDPNWQENSIQQSGKIATLAIEILGEKKNEIEGKF